MFTVARRAADLVKCLEPTKSSKWHDGHMVLDLPLLCGHDSNQMKILMEIPTTALANTSGPHFVQMSLRCRSLKGCRG